MPRPSIPLHGGAGRALARLALALLAWLAACAAHARPMDVEDLLQQEGVGQAFVTPGGRWLVAELRGPYAQAARFDFGDQLTDLFRTRIMIADLRRPGPLRPLFAPEPGAGYQAGPASPDGRRLLAPRPAATQASMRHAATATDGRARHLRDAWGSTIHWNITCAARRRRPMR